MFKKNNVLAFSLLGITFGFSNLTSLVTNTKTSSNIEEKTTFLATNTKKSSNIEEKTTFFTKNDFETHVNERATGFFTSYIKSTGWKILVSDDSLASCIKTHENFTILLNLDMWYYASLKQKFIHLKNFSSINFKTKDLLVDNEVKVVEYYFYKPVMIGSLTEDFKIFFRLVNNTIYCQLISYIRSGWCWIVDRNGIDASLKSNFAVTFY